MPPKQRVPRPLQRDRSSSRSHSHSHNHRHNRNNYKQAIGRSQITLGPDHSLDQMQLYVLLRHRVRGGGSHLERRCRHTS